MNATLSVNQLNVKYKKRSVLWDVSFSLPLGQLVGILGPNGAGKSTLLQSLLGLIKPSYGLIRLNHEPIEKYLHKIAYIPQKTQIDWNFPISVLKFVLMGSFHRMRSPDQNEKNKAKNILDQLQMLPFASRPISQLSKGQQQKLFIARSLLQEPDIFLMDEPFANLDMMTERVVMNIFKDLQKKGKTFLIVHHDLAKVKQYFDWVVFINTSLICSGPVQKVFNHQTIAQCFGKDHIFFEEMMQHLSKATQRK